MEQELLEFKDLAAKQASLENSIANLPFDAPAIYGVREFDRNLLPRLGVSEIHGNLREYWDGLTTALADFEITDEEAEHLAKESTRLGLSHRQVRVLHGRVFAFAIEQFNDDQFVSDKEAEKLARLRSCLQKLGWAPGD